MDVWCNGFSHKASLNFTYVKERDTAQITVTDCNAHLRIWLKMLGNKFDERWYYDLQNRKVFILKSGCRLKKFLLSHPQAIFVCQAFYFRSRYGYKKYKISSEMDFAMLFLLGKNEKKELNRQTCGFQNSFICAGPQKKDEKISVALTKSGRLWNRHWALKQ